MGLGMALMQLNVLLEHLRTSLYSYQYIVSDGKKSYFILYIELNDFAFKYFTEKCLKVDDNSVFKSV